MGIRDRCDPVHVGVPDLVHPVSRRGVHARQHRRIREIEVVGEDGISGERPVRGVRDLSLKHI